MELFKTISNEPPLSTNSAWIPKPNSKIFVCNPRHLGLNEADLKYIEFFSFEAVLLDADHLQLWSNDQRTRFLAVTFKYKLRLILQFDVGDLGKPKFQDFIVQMKPHLSIRIKNLEDLKNDFHDFMISYFSLQLTEATNLTEFQKLEFKFSGIPIFVEIACAQDSNKSMQSLNLAQAHYNFFETYGDLPSIFSTEKMEAFENGDIYWNLSPRYFNSTQAVHPEVSIIIPTYNRAHFLLSVISAIKNQNLLASKFEVIVVDDGSWDQTSKVIQSWLAENQLGFHFRYYYIPRSNIDEIKINRVGAIRNFGALNARSEKLLFLDSDILLPEDFLRNTLQADISNKVVQARRIDLDFEETTELMGRLNAQTFTRLAKNNSAQAREDFDQREYSNSDFAIWAASYCWYMTKSQFIELNGFRNGYVTYGWEDTDFIYRLRRLNRTLIASDQFVFHAYTLNASSEYHDGVFHRKLMLVSGAEIFFRRTLSFRALHCFIFCTFRALIINQKYRSHLPTDFELAPESNYIKMISINKVTELGESFLPLVKFDQLFSKSSVSQKSLPLLWPPLNDLKKLLILGGELSTLPTELLLNDKWACDQIRRIYISPGFSDTDNMINFLFVKTLRFNSGRSSNLKIQNSQAPLTLTDSLGQCFIEEMSFDSILVYDLELLEAFTELELLKSTQVLFVVLKIQKQNVLNWIAKLSLKIEILRDSQETFIVYARRA